MKLAEILLKLKEYDLTHEELTIVSIQSNAFGDGMMRLWIETGDTLPDDQTIDPEQASQLLVEWLGNIDDIEYVEYECFNKVYDVHEVKIEHK